MSVKKSLPKICFVTGTRADYGHLKPLLQLASNDADIEFQLIVMAMHLSKAFGYTVDEIIGDGIPISVKVPNLCEGDTPEAIAQSTANGLSGVAAALQQLKPDVVVIFGDRYEMWSAAQAALFAAIPIVHIAGGDISEGAYDDAIRHSLTKMSQLHFVTNAQSEQRVLQMGEPEDNVFNIGSLCVDTILNTEFLSKQALEASLHIDLSVPTILVTFHPSTHHADTIDEELLAFVSAMEELAEDFQFILTKPSLDAGGLAVHKQFDELGRREQFHVFESLGSLRYLSVLKQVKLVLGNSSSGLYEVPSFGIPTVNVGDRQQGRLMASSVFNCPCTVEDIVSTVKSALKSNLEGTVNPYGTGNTAPMILKLLKDKVTGLTTTKKFNEWHSPQADVYSHRSQPILQSHTA